MQKPQAKEEKVKDRSSMAVTINPYNELEETEAAKEKKKLVKQSVKMKVSGSKTRSQIWPHFEHLLCFRCRGEHLTCIILWNPQ